MPTLSIPADRAQSQYGKGKLVDLATQKVNEKTLSTTASELCACMQVLWRMPVPAWAVDGYTRRAPCVWPSICVRTRENWPRSPQLHTCQNTPKSAMCYRCSEQKLELVRFKTLLKRIAPDGMFRQANEEFAHNLMDLRKLPKHGR